MICKVLVVDDDKELIQIIRHYLENHDFQVIYTSNSRKAVELAGKSKPDVIITDVQMPGLDGRNLCRALKQSPGLKNIPVIIISGKKITEKDILEGYGKGADDYLIKPFSFPILVAKIKNLLLRYERCARTSKTVKKWKMAINFESREIKMGGEKVNLTRKEFDLLELLISKKGKILSVPYLLENIWGYDPANYNDPHTIEVHISSLRKKLGKKVGQSVKKITGHGYKMEC